MSLRYAPLLEHLAARHEVDLLVIDHGAGTPDLRELAGRLHSVEVVPLPRIRTRTRRLGARLAGLMPWTVAHSLKSLAAPEIAAIVAAKFTAGRYDLVLWAGREMLENAIRFRRRFPGTRFVLDIIDSPYLYAGRELGTGQAGAGAAYDLWKIGRMERWARAHMDAVIYISPVDAAAAPPAAGERIVVLANGVLADAGPGAAAGTPGKRLGFLGNMTYPPNVRAALALHRDVYLPLRREHPDLELLVIGREPAAEIRALAGPGVTVTGTVPEVWPWIERADVFVFPFDTGAGLQNKVLEAMFAGKPVVTTPACLGALGAQVPRDLLSGADAPALLALVRDLIERPEEARALGERGRAFARRSFDWQSLLPRFEAAIVGREPAGADPAGG